MKQTQLFKNIDLFVSKALQFYELYKAAAPPYTYVSPGDDEEEDKEVESENAPEQYSELLDLARQVSDEDLSHELILIAEMYKRALEIGGGYNAVNNGVSNLINNYLDDEDDPEQARVEDTLNELVKDLRMRAGGAAALNKPDKPEVIAQLRALKHNLNQKFVQEELKQLEESEMTSEEVGGLSQYEEKAKSTFDPTGGISLEEAQKGKGRGYSFQTKRTPKDWIQSFENEKSRYSSLLLDESNANVKDKIQKLINVLSQLVIATKQKQELSDVLQTAPDEELQKQLSEVQKQIDQLKNSRKTLRDGIRTYNLAKSQKELEDKFNKSRDPREKLLLQQETELYKALSSKDIGKQEEIKLRRILIKSMSGGNMPSGDTLRNMLNKIEVAKSKRKPIEVYRKEEAVRTRAVKESGNLKGQIVELRQKIATQKNEIRKAIIRKLDAEKHSTFQPFLNSIAEAKARNDMPAVEAATKALNTAINTYAENQPGVLNYIENAKQFYAFRDKAEALEKTNIIETPGELPEQMKINILEIVNFGRQLANQYKGQKVYSTILNSVAKIVKTLEERIQ